MARSNRDFPIEGMAAVASVQVQREHDERLSQMQCPDDDRQIAVRVHLEGEDRTVYVATEAEAQLASQGKFPVTLRSHGGEVVWMDNASDILFLEDLDRFVCEAQERLARGEYSWWGRLKRRLFA